MLHCVLMGGIGTSHGGRDTLWTSVWSLPIPSKIKIFLWRSLHELLPCMANLFYHKIVSNPICFRCTRKPETIIHALWCCSSTKELLNFSRQMKRNHFTSLSLSWIVVGIAAGWAASFGCCPDFVDVQIEGMFRLSLFLLFYP
ncbi:uncharacterized protein LOC18778457 isoform X1 [Prunus persica]|uniref:uncharacterized protein LOC18778457 isoform X1 n=1 Tax=Prunus persica TaxID=3760 RepID=UPI0009AB2E8D|nr:uncharacterized protein LOC18778457 isoform X1 [Prunus persica]